MLGFGAVKCDLFYARKASFSKKILRVIRIIGVKLLNYKAIVEIRVKILRRPFMIERLYIEIKFSISTET